MDRRPYWIIVSASESDRDSYWEWPQVDVVQAADDTEIEDYLQHNYLDEEVCGVYGPFCQKPQQREA